MRSSQLQVVVENTVPFSHGNFKSNEKYIDALVDSYLELRIRRVLNSLTRERRYSLVKENSK